MHQPRTPRFLVTRAPLTVSIPESLPDRRRTRRARRRSRSILLRLHVEELAALREPRLVEFE